jgi:phage baseplate assembly protein gpV
VRISRIGEEDSVTGWIPVLASCAGSDAGLSLLPDVDDQVLVVSLDEKQIKQMVIGGIWSNNCAPPETGENAEADLNQDGSNSLRFFKSRSGAMFIFDDSEGQEKVQIISSGGKSRFEFLDADEAVCLTTENDLTIGAKGNILIDAEEIGLTAEKQFDLSGEELQVSTTKDTGVEADKGVSVTGSGLALN